jgi:methionine biosynthesis protein MetW
MSIGSIQKFQNKGWEKPLDMMYFSRRVVLKNFKEESVLDLGCGSGYLLEKLLEKNTDLKISGLDISPVAIEKARAKGFDCKLFDITDTLPFENNAFDSVLLIDVLEHMFEPIEVLKEAVRVTKKYVYISVPNFVSLPARFQVMLGKVPENNTLRKGHTYWITRNVLHRLIKDCGLVIEREFVNTFWASKPILGTIMGLGVKLWPGLFGLSFVIKAKKINT